MKHALTAPGFNIEEKRDQSGSFFKKKKEKRSHNVVLTSIFRFQMEGEIWIFCE